MEPKANAATNGSAAPPVETASPPALRLTTDGTPETVFGMKVLFDKIVGLQPVKLVTRQLKRKKNGRSESL